MLTINDLKNKMTVLIDGTPYQILEVKHLHMGRGGSSLQTKIKNLLTAQVFSRNFKPADNFREADIKKRELVYLYTHRGEFLFAPRPPEAAGTPAEGPGATKAKPSDRFSLSSHTLGTARRWLTSNTVVTAMFLGEKLLNIAVPIKMDLEVTESPPGLQGDTVSAATKTVTLETGAKIQTPLFINAGDTIRVNTESGEYVERVTKAG